MKSLLSRSNRAAGSNWDVIVGKVGAVTSIVGVIIIVAIGIVFWLFIKKRIRTAELDTNE